MLTNQLPASTVWELLAALVAGEGDHVEDVACLAEAIDRLAADGEIEELALVFAPLPGRTAAVYHVEQSDLGALEPCRVEVFDNPVRAWQAFRVVGSRSRSLVSVRADVRRTVATMRPGGDLHMPLPDAYRLDGPAGVGAASRWSHLAQALWPSGLARGGGEADEIAAREATGAAPAAAGIPPPAQARVSTAGETLRERHVDAGPEPSSGRSAAPTPVGRLRAAVGRLTAVHVAIAVVAVVLAFVFIRFTVDDAFITWRYGLTFAHSGHWNWNASGPTVEAYTSFTYAVLSIVPALMHIPTELFFKLVSLGIIGGYIGWVRRLRLPQRQRLVLYAVALATPVFYIQLFSGLETVAFALLIAVVFAAIYRDGRLGRAGYAAVALVALTRPEGLAFAAVAVVWVLAIDRRKQHWLGAGAVVGALGVYWGWRAQHFGWFWPNTYYVKSGHRPPLVHQVIDVLSGLGPAVAVAVLVVVAGSLLGRRLERGSGRDRRQMLQDATPVVLALLSGLVVLFLYKQSNLAMDFADRFLWQLAFPVVAVVLARPIVLLARHDGDRTVTDVWGLGAIGITATVAIAYHPDATTQVVVLAAVATLAVAVVIRLASGQTAATMVAVVGLAALVSWVPVSNMVGWAAYRYRLQYAHQAMGRVLADSNITGAIAIGDAGVLPFQVGQRVIDLDGLANTELSHGTFTAADMRRSNVQFVVLLSGTPQPAGAWLTGPGQIVSHDYVVNQAGFWWSQGPEFSPSYYLNFWITPKLAKPGLLRRLQAVTDESMRQDAKDDATLLGDHLFDLPFLGGN